MKYKVGDKVKVKSWDELLKCGEIDAGDIVVDGWETFVEEMKPFCGEIVTIKNFVDNNYHINEDVQSWIWSDWMFEDVSMVYHPNHYNHGMECIDEMIMVFGKEVVAHFCLCNVWKYRKRALYKNGEEDMNKADWYMDKYKELIKE